MCIHAEKHTCFRFDPFVGGGGGYTAAQDSRGKEHIRGWGRGTQHRISSLGVDCITRSKLQIQTHIGNGFRVK
jgi:hypothetical protein